MHISIPISDTMEFINATEISPLISKVQIKVCYVGQQPNRNNTVITKEVATNLGKKLPGCPIVGYFNEEANDFDGHNREVIVNDDGFKVVDITKPYGFVDINAKVWFEKFLDEGIEHEYLVTEGYLWTKIYEESKRVITEGNNQSMELNSTKGFWTNDDKSHKRIFIINDGLIEKLCILGQEVEPCFEGSQIRSHFSLEDIPDFTNFKTAMFSMIDEVKDILSKGGSQQVMEKELENQNQETPIEENFEKKEKETSPTLENTDEKGKEDTTDEKEDKKKKDYNLEDIIEYSKLMSDFSELSRQHTELQQSYENLTKEIESLKTFKLKAEKKEKQDLIDSFYMLSDEDKKNVINNIDNYSLRDIEAELSIICVRNRVNFNENSEQDQQPNQQFSLNIGNMNNNEPDNDDPEWVKAVMAVNK